MCEHKFHSSREIDECTPAMNNPKDIPSLPISLIPKSVSAGFKKLPGASLLDSPSMATHAMIRMLDRMPRIDV